MTHQMAEQNSSFPFYFASWYKKSPYFQRTVEAGCTSWDLYNHMLIPTLYDDDIKEYWHLVEKVTLWDVAVERQVQITGPDAARFTQLLTPRDLSQTQPEQCKYVLLCAPDLRRHIRSLCERAMPHLRVLSMAEIPQTIELKSYGVVTL